MNGTRVLVVEDEALMRKVLVVALRSQGCATLEADCGRAALKLIDEQTPDAILLDLGLPDMDGVEVISQLRVKHPTLPVILLSAHGEERHQIRALDAGADDYVTKPFREGELMARLRAAVRRAVPGEKSVLSIGDLSILAVEHRVLLKNHDVQLTPTEFKLLSILAKNAGRIVTHGQLLSEVWGANRVDEVQYLRVYMKQLREKLEEIPSQPRRILTALGVGYRLVSMPAQ
jgi:two-component system, OmpR family, KDP operon response regulator KdpE